MTRALVVAVFFVLGAAEACASSTAAPDAAALDAGSRDVGPFPGCGFVDSLPTACEDDSDCAVVHHLAACCGPIEALGVAVAAVPTFDAWEPACRIELRPCGCPGGPGVPVAQSGERADGSDLHVACVVRGAVRECLSYVDARPLDGP